MGRTSRHPAKVLQRGAPGRIVQAPAQRSGACTRRPPKRRGEGPCDYSSPISYTGVDAGADSFRRNHLSRSGTKKPHERHTRLRSGTSKRGSQLQVQIFQTIITHSEDS
jgi:hypothetical protein